MGFAITLFFPEFVQFSSRRPGAWPLCAGSLVWAMLSLVWAMLSLTGALDFSESRGNFILGKTGLSVSESEKGRAARASSSQWRGS